SFTYPRYWPSTHTPDVFSTSVAPTNSTSPKTSLLCAHICPSNGTTRHKKSTWFKSLGAKWVLILLASPFKRVLHASDTMRVMSLLTLGRSWNHAGRATNLGSNHLSRHDQLNSAVLLATGGSGVRGYGLSLAKSLADDRSNRDTLLNQVIAHRSSSFF